MERKQLPEDFKDFINCLNSNNVKYLLLGGWAVGIHGHPRLTKDIDFLVSIDNCYSRREIVKVENVEISVISKSDLIVNKRSSGRGQDLTDAVKLEYSKE